MYTYSISRVSENKWIYIECIEEDSALEHAPFVELVKTIAMKWNNGLWQGHISQEGQMRYRIENDPLNLVYQWDDLYGIVLEYAQASPDPVVTILGEYYGIGVTGVCFGR